MCNLTVPLEAITVPLEDPGHTAAQMILEDQGACRARSGCCGSCTDAEPSADQPPATNAQLTPDLAQDFFAIADPHRSWFNLHYQDQLMFQQQRCAAGTQSVALALGQVVFITRTGGKPEHTGLFGTVVSAPACDASALAPPGIGTGRVRVKVRANVPMDPDCNMDAYKVLCLNPANVWPVATPHGFCMLDVLAGNLGLCSAIVTGDVHMATLLLACGATCFNSVNNADARWTVFGGDANTLLRIAASVGDFEMVRMSITCGAIINMSDMHGTTPLMVAACGGHAEIVKVLVMCGAFPNYRQLSRVVNSHGTCMTALLMAVCNCHVDVARVLLAHGAEADLCSSFGNTALALAAHKGFEDAVELLVSHGADINLANYRGQTPLILGVSADVRAMHMAPLAPCARRICKRRAYCDTRENTRHACQTVYSAKSTVAIDIATHTKKCPPRRILRVCDEQLANACPPAYSARIHCTNHRTMCHGVCAHAHAPTLACRFIGAILMTIHVQCIGIGRQHQDRAPAA